jgi:hypothetical protein
MYTNLCIFSDNNNIICYCGSQSTYSTSICGTFNLFAYDTVDDYTSSISLMSNVTGFVVRCCIVESILQSTLEYFFFHSLCLSIVFNFFPNIKSLNVTQT